MILVEGSLKEREAKVLLWTSCLERESDLSRYCQCCQLVWSVLDKACVGESTRADNVILIVQMKSHVFKVPKNRLTIGIVCKKVPKIITNIVQIAFKIVLT